MAHSPNSCIAVTSRSIASRLPLLSAYLGHTDPQTTYWYLDAAPELMAEAARRLEAGSPGDDRDRS